MAVNANIIEMLYKSFKATGFVVFPFNAVISPILGNSCDSLMQILQVES